MKFKAITIYEDSEIDHKIRQLGLRRTARIANVSVTYVFDLLKGKRIASQRIYSRLREAVENAAHSSTIC